MKGIFYDRPEKYKYSFAFNSQIKSVISEEKDKYLSKASLDQIRKFVPEIDSKKIDLLPFSANCFVGNRLNENDDGLSTKEAILAAELCPLSFIDIEHSRKDLIGVITTAGFSEFGTDKILTKEEVKNLKTPFNVWIGGVFWKIPNPDLTDYIEETNNPDSSNYLAASISWEIAFSEFDLIVIDANKRNFEDGKIISDPTEISQLESKLKSLGGIGKTDDGKKIGRIPKNDILFLGVGITNSPAAAVKGIAVNKNDKELEVEASNMKNEEIVDKLMKLLDSFKLESTEIVNILAKKSKTSCAVNCPECGQPMDMEDEMDDNMEVLCAKCGKKSTAKMWKNGKDKEIKEESKANNDKKVKNNENSLSQAQNNDVKQNTNIYMKIKSLKELTDENVKEYKASEIQEVFATDLKEQLDSEIKKINDKYVKDLGEKDNAIKAATDKVATLEKTAKEVQDKLDELSKNHEKLVKANEEKEKLETFSNRMSKIDETFDLSEEEKKIIGDEVKSVENDEAFATYLKKMETLLSAKKKAGKVFDPKTKKWMSQEEMDKMHEEMKTSKASTNTVEDVTKDGKKTEATIPNTTSTEPTLIDKAKAAFGSDGWEMEKSKRIRKN